MPSAIFILKTCEKLNVLDFFSCSKATLFIFWITLH